MKALLVLLLLAAGCMVGPNYYEPEALTQQHFVEAKDAISSEDNLCTWWKQFNDPLLDALIAKAVESNFDLLLSIEKISQARAQYRIERSRLWPEIDLDASAIRARNSQTSLNTATAVGVDSTQTFVDNSTALGPPIQNTFQVGFDAIWELDFFGKFRRGKRAAYFDWQAAGENAQAVLISVISEVARNYVILRSLQAQMYLTQQKIEADIELLELTIALFASGLSSELDVDTLLSNLETDRATLPPLETSLKQTIYGLAFLLGQETQGFAEQFNEIKPIPLFIHKVPVGLPSDLLRRRPDIRSAERSLAAATERIGVAVADLFPHIALTGAGFGYQSAKTSNLFTPPSRIWSIGPTLNWDLFDFGRTRAAVAVQNSLQRQALITYEQTVIASLKDVEGALVAYFEEQKRNLFLDDKLVADKRFLELTNDLYMAGLSDDQQVLLARIKTLETEIGKIGSTQALASDLIALYKALGGDWECSSTP